MSDVTGHDPDCGYRFEARACDCECGNWKPMLEAAEAKLEAIRELRQKHKNYELLEDEFVQGIDAIIDEEGVV